MRKTKKLRQRRRRTRRRQRGGSDAKTVVVIETRQHPAMAFVLRNALTELDSSWSVLVFHGTQNAEWLQGLLNGELKDLAGRITLRSLDRATLDGATLSNLMRDRGFIEQIPTEVFLVLQMDSMICPGRAKGLEEFMNYDYVGAPWRTDWKDVTYHVGNGGSSLRKKSKMLEVIEKCNETEDMGLNEDMFYSRKCATPLLKKPSVEDAKRFSVETAMYPNPILIHATWRSLGQEDMKALRGSCLGLEKLEGFQRG